MKGQTETTRWTEDERRSSGVPSEKVWWREREKKRRFQRSKQGQTDGEKKTEKEPAKRGGCLCLSVTLSAGGGLREIMEGRMEG